MTVKLVHTLPVANQLGECVLWQEQTGEVVWTDILGRTLYRYHFASDSLRTTPTPDRLASFGFCANSNRLIAAFASGVSLYDPDSGNLEVLFPLPDPIELRLNDGRVDRQGRFWVGSMIENADNNSELAHKHGQLYCIDAQGECHVRLSGIRINNSLCWSPDGGTAYFADSPTHTIQAFDVNPSNGALQNPSVFARTAPGIHPDGSTVDAQGCLWNAEWGSGELVRYSPTGAALLRTALPAKQLTCPAFGGPDLQHLFVTSAACDLSDQQRLAQPHAGHLFILETPYQGLVEERYRYAH